MAFVVEGPRGGGTDAIDHLERAPRWALSSGRYLETGQRGLGGGLEYAVDNSVCRLRFIDGATCGDVLAEIDAALDVWASGHPFLAFENVSNRVEPTYPLARDRPRGLGAEIDFFAANARQFVPFRTPNTTGYTIFTETFEQNLTLTNGQVLPSVRAIDSADVRFNAARCYYIDTTMARDECVHFPSLALHEIGHALGIGHPDENPRFNLDNDSNPANAVALDCRNPSNGLKVSLTYKGAAVMIGQNVQGPGRWRRGLTYDDVAARDALYPYCGGEPVARYAGEWGAFAVAANGQGGRARLRGSKVEATSLALEQCGLISGATCRLVAVFQSCFAYAKGGGRDGYSVAPRQDLARINSVLSCRASGQLSGQAASGQCRSVTDFCAFE